MPTVPAGSEEVGIDNGGGATVSEIDAVAVADALSLTFTVKLAGPAALGVPDTVPPADKLNPAGSVPVATVHVYGGVPPAAASACE